MKIYEITIKPLSGFGTTLKGDTLFGHICWQAAYDDGLFGRSIESLLSNYSENPFVVMSSAYPRLNEYTAFKSPDMPLDALFDFEGKDKKEILKERKDLKKKNWMLIKTYDETVSLRGLNYISDSELLEVAQKTLTEGTERELRKGSADNFTASFSQPHNTISRITGTTGSGMFAPYSIEQKVFLPETELVIFVGIDKSISIEQVDRALKKIGEFGYGRDASTGLGRFDVCDINKVDLLNNTDDTNACYTLSPCVPGKEKYNNVYFSPFVRFGKHGDVFAKSGNPFKSPVIMADEGAVFIPKTIDVFEKPYIGSSVTNISKAEPGTVMQGYSLYISVKAEV